MTAVEALGMFRRHRTTTERQAEAALAKIEAALETLRSEFKVLAPYEMTRRALKPRRVSIKEIAELGIELNRGLLAKWRIKADVDGNDWEAMVMSTPLLQILDNLVHNACLWVSTVPSETRRIGIVLAPEGNRLLVADTGPGIDEEVAPHLFEPFFSMKAGGKGLGLYISSELAKAIGGTLRLAGTTDVRPDLATGAMFVLDIDPTTRVLGPEPEEGANG
jgi:C4-dicarboxylate-specific signal transduction histidine kinase